MPRGQSERFRGLLRLKRLRARSRTEIEGFAEDKRKRRGDFSYSQYERNERAGDEEYRHKRDKLFIDGGDSLHSSENYRRGDDRQDDSRYPGAYPYGALKRDRDRV